MMMPTGHGIQACALAARDGNITGFTNIEPTMAGKWLELRLVIGVLACLRIERGKPLARLGHRRSPIHLRGRLYRQNDRFLAIAVLLDVKTYLRSDNFNGGGSCTEQ